MITAIVRHKLPQDIDYAACREQSHKIAPSFRELKGLVSKHFICSESSPSGRCVPMGANADAKAFYTGPWRTASCSSATA
jgi:hypothetical protein